MKEQIGRLYWGVRIVRNKESRTLHVYADEIRIQDGDLLLLGHLQNEANGPTEPASFLYRSFARGTWTDVYSASCLDGNEIGEEHDVNDKTGQDARTGCD
jgi:hypothetical protein